MKRLVSGKTFRMAALSCAAALAISAPSYAQYDNNGGMTTPQPTPPSIPADAAGTASDAKGQTAKDAQGRGPQIDPKEQAAYDAYLAAKDNDKKIQAGKQFLDKFPKSVYGPRVTNDMVGFYYTKADWNNFNSMADKALAINPNNTAVLPMVAWVNARNFKDGEPNGQAVLDKSETQAKHAIELLKAMPKPANLTDDQFNQVKAASIAQAHGALGLVYFHEQNPAAASAELEQVTNPDASSVFILAASYEMQDEHAKALAQFQKCSTMPGQLQTPCQQGAAQAAKETGH